MCVYIECEMCMCTLCYASMHMPDNTLHNAIHVHVHVSLTDAIIQLNFISTDVLELPGVPPKCSTVPVACSNSHSLSVWNWVKVRGHAATECLV